MSVYPEAGEMWTEERQRKAVVLRWVGCRGRVGKEDTSGKMNQISSLWSLDPWDGGGCLLLPSPVCARLLIFLGPMAQDLFLAQS